MKIITDLTHAQISAQDLKQADLVKKVKEIHNKIHTAKKEDNNVWAQLPQIITDAEIKEIQKKARWVRENCDVLIVLGVGGSYAGAFAGQQWIRRTENCKLKTVKESKADKKIDVEYLGTSFDPSPLIYMLNKYSGKKVCVNVISKSGTTLEITTAFNAIDQLLQKIYPDETERNKHIIVTTSDNEGYLREYAKNNNVTAFTMLDGVGGRYSMLCAVGYFPLAVAGVDIMQIHIGAREAYKNLNTSDLNVNEAYRYAVARYLMHEKHNKQIEIFASFQENLEGLGKWWQQLYGESEGKDGKGLLPVPLVYSRDLHSMGQYVQQGNPLFFETIIDVKKDPIDLKLNAKPKERMLQVPVASMAAINRAAFKGTVKAHADAGVPVVIVTSEKLDAYGFGYLIYFFEIACAMSAFLIGVDPFNQPGVEFYKKNMREELRKR